jgi:hypothetical protein
MPNSALADVANALSLQLIDDAGMANSIKKKLQAAQNASGQTRSSILSALRDEINAQSGKHMTSVAVKVLVNDIQSLIFQNLP